MKEKTFTYTLTLPLSTERFQEDILDKRLEIARNIYNSVLGNAMKRYNLMVQSKEYRKLKKQLNNSNKLYHECEVIKVKNKLNKNRKELYKQIQSMNLKYGLSQYSLYEDVKLMYKHFKDNIGSLEAQAITDRVWSSLDKLLYGDGNKVCFKKYGEVNSIENKWNKSGLKYDLDSNNIIWKDLEIPVIIKPNDLYAQKAIQDRVKYCRIVRKLIRGGYKYYVQLVMEGIPPKKCDKETGEVKTYIGKGNVGIDIGTRTLAISSQFDVKLLELCPEIENLQNIKTKLQRKLDRSRRSMNPNNYNENGTIKRGIKLKWIKSNYYIKIQMELADIARKQACIRKQSHEKLANYIISLGDDIKIETMSYKGLQARAKKTTINKKTGKFNKKKRFGKSLANKAPSMFLTILGNKLKWEGKELKKIDTWKVKASQYNHIEDLFVKKNLSKRWNDFGEFKIQRDLYSSFLIMNVEDNLSSINRDLCIETFDNFKKLHDIEIERLKNSELSTALRNVI